MLFFWFWFPAATCHRQRFILFLFSAFQFCCFLCFVVSSVFEKIERNNETQQSSVSRDVRRDAIDEAQKAKRQSKEKSTSHTLSLSLACFPQSSRHPSCILFVRFLIDFCHSTSINLVLFSSLFASVRQA